MALRTVKRVSLLLWVAFALSGCDQYVATVGTNDPKTFVQNFYDRLGRNEVRVIDCGAFVEKNFHGKSYKVAKADIMGKNGFGAQVENVMGIVYDEGADMIYSMGLEDFNKFLTNGDVSVFPTPKNLTVN
jgi:hypothetical protein